MTWVKARDDDCGLIYRKDPFRQKSLSVWPCALDGYYVSINDSQGLENNLTLLIKDLNELLETLKC